MLNKIILAVIIVGGLIRVASSDIDETPNIVVQHLLAWVVYELCKILIV